MAITFGSTSAPSQVTTYLDSLFAQSLANYKKTLIDNIGATNAVLHKIINSDQYESADGGLYFAEPLMYGLASADSYDGYDELGTTPIDGVTQAQYEWRQMSVPIVYNMKEVIQNQHKLVDLVKTKIKQSEMGLQEYFAQALWWGNQPNGGAITTPRVSQVNGSSSIEPLGKLISYGATSLTVGNLAEATYTWWKNHYKESAATTYAAFLLEMTKMYNSCSLGTGGSPDLIIMDQTTYELYCHAYFSIYKHAPGGGDNTFPFLATKFLNATVVMDDKVPDVYTGAPGTAVGGVVDPTTMTYGSAYFINTKFLKLRYHPERNFEMLKDENGKTFAKPINGDSRVGHIGWMGNFTISNRRKHGVIGKIARTLS